MSRRLKYWGWGYEDEQPSEAELRATAGLIRQHLGFGAEVPAQPVPLSAVTLPEPRVSPPASLAPICFSDPYERALHAYGRSYMDVLRAFRGRFDHAPDVVVRPRDETELQATLDWAIPAGAAVIPFGGGTSVVGGVEPRVGERFNGAVTIDLKALDRVLEVDPISRAARIQAGAIGPRLEEQLAQHGFTSAPLPPVLPVLDPGRLDRHPRRRPLRHPLHAHRRPGRVGSRAHAGGDLGIAAAARIGRRGVARPDADRLRGNARRDHRGVGPDPPEAHPSHLGRRASSTTS